MEAYRAGKCWLLAELDCCGRTVTLGLLGTGTMPAVGQSFLLAATHSNRMMQVNVDEHFSHCRYEGDFKADLCLF